MSIQRDVFDLFLVKLVEDKDFPHLLIEELRKLCESSEIWSEDKILEKLNRWIDNGSEDKEN